jgi:hypothetical protein
MVLSPLKSIRKKCLDCSGDSRKEVKECPILDCPLYPYRFGKNPKRKGIGRKDNLNATKSVKTPHSRESFKRQKVKV